MSDVQNDMALFAEMWDEQVRSLWPEDYPQQLASLLQQQGALNILDCSGGTGYPLIELKQLGWDVTYSDSSPEMLDFFSQKIATEKLDIPHYLSLWQQLAENVPETYDAVLCRGNSLLQMSDVTFSFDVMKQKMTEALKGMFSKVAEGGMLYIDMPNPSTSKPSMPYHNNFDAMVTTVSYDPTTNIRTTHDVKKYSTNHEIFSTHHVYPLDPEELIGMLLHAGFQRVERSDIEEAFYIDAYLAFK